MLPSPREDQNGGSMKLKTKQKHIEEKERKWPVMGTCFLKARVKKKKKQETIEKTLKTI